MTDTITIEIPRNEASTVAYVLDVAARERRTPNGTISRSGKGEHTWTESFRETLSGVAEAIRKATEGA
jgi:hypothetical protein